MVVQIGLHAALSPLDHLVYLSEAEAHTRAQAAQMQEQMEIEQQQQEQEQEVELPLLKRPRTEPDGPPTAAEHGSVAGCPAAADAVDEIAPGVQVMVLLMGLPGSGASPKQRHSQWNGSHLKCEDAPSADCAAPGQA
jgi:hypothetical protein